MNEHKPSTVVITAIGSAVCNAAITCDDSIVRVAALSVSMETRKSSLIHRALIVGYWIDSSKEEGEGLMATTSARLQISTQQDMP